MGHSSTNDDGDVSLFLRSLKSKEDIGLSSDPFVLDLDFTTKKTLIVVCIAIMYYGLL